LITRFENESAIARIESVGSHRLSSACSGKKRTICGRNAARILAKGETYDCFPIGKSEPPSTRLDIFVSEPFDFDEEYAQAEWLDVAGIPSPILRIETLIEMKRASNRPKDLGDAGELKKLLDIRADERAND
jgi:hypothetical protein